MRVFDGMYHDVLHERDRHPVLEEIRQFIRAGFADERDLPVLVDADEQGFTERRYARLKRPSAARLAEALVVCRAAIGDEGGGQV